MTEKKPDGGCAFPLAEEMENGRSVASSYGMSLRDYFAAALIHGGYEVSEEDWDKVARHAYGIADAMLKARQS